MTAPNACTWTVQSNASFIAVTSPSGGTGSGSVTLDVSSNADFLRGGTLTIAGQTATVVQRGPAGFVNCVTSIIHCISLSCDSQTFSGDGGTGELILGAPASCAWIAAGSVPWVNVYATSLQNQAHGLGNGHFGFSVAANPTEAQRSADISAGGATFRITQLACSYSLSTTSLNVVATGATATIAVTTSCPSPWTASPCNCRNAAASLRVRRPEQPSQLALGGGVGGVARSGGRLNSDRVACAVFTYVDHVRFPAFAVRFGKNPVAAIVQFKLSGHMLRFRGSIFLQTFAKRQPVFQIGTQAPFGLGPLPEKSGQKKFLCVCQLRTISTPSAGPRVTNQNSRTRSYDVELVQLLSFGSPRVRRLV